MNSYKKVELIGDESKNCEHIKKNIDEKQIEVKQFIENDRKLDNIKDKFKVIKNENFKKVNKDEINEKLLKLIEDIVFKILEKQKNNKNNNLNKHSISKLNKKPKKFTKKVKNNWVYLK